MHKFTIGENTAMRPWNVLIEATVQGSKIRGTITCHSGSESKARDLARMTFINQLRRAGVWAYSTEEEEEKESSKVVKVTKYYAPYWDHVKVVDIIDLNSRDLSFSMEELEDAALMASPMRKPKKRRSSAQVVTDKREEHQKVVKKKEAQVEKKKKSAANKQAKIELMQVVKEYFTGKEAKVIKTAVKELDRTYQRIRYALFQIRDNGYNNIEYTLIETKIDGNKAFQLKQK